MKKIIILIAILCGFGFCEINENAAIDLFGGNCHISQLNEFHNGEKYFYCDSGLVTFDFAKREIIFGTLGSSKVKTVLLFNRGWDKRGNTKHKEKSVVFYRSREFDFAILDKAEFKWSGDIYEFYCKFKEKQKPQRVE